MLYTLIAIMPFNTVYIHNDKLAILYLQILLLLIIMENKYFMRIQEITLLNTCTYIEISAGLFIVIAKVAEEFVPYSMFNSKMFIMNDFRNDSNTN